jgi:hypothetical protein
MFAWKLAPELEMWWMEIEWRMIDFWNGDGRTGGSAMTNDEHLGSGRIGRR